LKPSKNPPPNKTTTITSAITIFNADFFLIVFFPIPNTP
jgi:hypothetical protein